MLLATSLSPTTQAPTTHNIVTYYSGSHDPVSDRGSILIDYRPAYTDDLQQSSIRRSLCQRVSPPRAKHICQAFGALRVKQRSLLAKKNEQHWVQGPNVCSHFTPSAMHLAGLLFPLLQLLIYVTTMLVYNNSYPIKHNS